jgi:hypothetical protein
MIRREHRRVTKREHMLQHRFIGPGRERAKTAGLEAPAQHVAQPLGSIEPLLQQIALPPALCQFGVEPSPSRQPGGHVAEKETEPAHFEGRPT